MFSSISSSFPLTTEQIYWAIVLLAALFGGALVLLIVRKFMKVARRRSDDAIFGMDSLSSLRRKGLLTPEEAARVSQAIVKKATRLGTGGDAATVEQLQLLAQIGTPPPQAAARPGPNPPRPPTASVGKEPKPSAGVGGAARSAPDPAVAPGKQDSGEEAGKEQAESVSLAVLLERGLISEGEYRRLVERFRSGKGSG